jgi:phytoene desaturase
VVYLGVGKKVGNLAHHTLFLDKDWESSFDRIFNPEHAAWPETPSYYVNVPSLTDTTAAPEGCETLFILVPLAPGLEDSPEQRERFYTLIMDHLERTIGEDIRSAVEVKRIFALTDFEERYNAYKGTALGLSHTLFQTALFRPAHQSHKVENLYYTGQYTHPGIGVPMTLISSEIVAKEIREAYPPEG